MSSENEILEGASAPVVEPLLLSDVKETLDELHYEIDNHGRGTSVGILCAKAERVVRALLAEHLKVPE